MKRRAVIDVGTNSVKLLVGELAESGAITPLLEQSEQTRLGEGFYQTHLLQPEAIERTARSVARFACLAREFQPERIRVVATSAARDARNQAGLLHAIREASSLTVEVLSGEHEARMAFAGVTTDPALADRPLLIVDVGGGSTEFILGRGAAQHFRQSFPLGSVRLLEQIQPSDPPGVADWQNCLTRLEEIFSAQIRPALAPALNGFQGGEIQLVGVGGTTTILARMKLQSDTFERDGIESVRLARTEVASACAHLWSLPLAERRKIPGLPANRADVILMGAAIFTRLMEELAFAELRVSTRGLRFAALVDEG